MLPSGHAVNPAKRQLKKLKFSTMLVHAQDVLHDPRLQLAPVTCK